MKTEVERDREQEFIEGLTILTTSGERRVAKGIEVHLD